MPDPFNSDRQQCEAHFDKLSASASLLLLFVATR